MSLKYTGFTRINGPGCNHLIVSLEKNGNSHTFQTHPAEVDEFIEAVAELVPGLTPEASALEKRVKAKLLLDLSYYRAEGKTLTQIQDVELEVL